MEGALNSEANKKIFNIFGISIEIYDETHIKICFLGIKIQFPMWKYYKLKRQNPFYKYKERKTDITQIPPASGHLREIQLANLFLLKELDFVCKQNGISYWLDFGTMLGAVRHKGFIPWDDDVDVGMMADDYEKIIPAFENSCRDKNIYATYVRDSKHPALYMIKVKHRKCPYLFVDIFPYYFYGKNISDFDQLEKTKEIKQKRKEELKNVDFNTSDEELKNLHTKLMKEIIVCEKSEDIEKQDLVWGVQYKHQWKNWFSSYDTIFPLRPIQFEGYEFCGINKPEEYLSKLYGDYMAYPSKITLGHSIYKNKTKEEMEIIKSYAEDFLKTSVNSK